jgi:hypothetical protein
MFRGSRTGLLVFPVWLIAAVLMAPACQSPTAASDTPSVDDFLITSVTPDPVNADAATDGKTYRVVRGNNQPDEILAFDWKTSFTVRLTLNDKADDDDYLNFPVDITSATIKVQQASGGILSPPTGGDTEHFDYVISNTSSNRFCCVNASNETTFDVWYDLPSLRKEALITVSLAFKDTDGVAFSKSIDVRVNP